MYLCASKGLYCVILLCGSSEKVNGHLASVKAPQKYSQHHSQQVQPDFQEFVRGPVRVVSVICGTESEEKNVTFMGIALTVFVNCVVYKI